MKNLVSEIEINYLSAVKLSDAPTITSSRSVESILREKWSSGINVAEEFNVLFLNRANKVIGFYNLSKGGTISTIVDIKILMAMALKSLCSSIILSHNHPSGNLAPSSADIQITKKIQNACEFFDIKVLDHIILTGDGYYSFADKGIIDA